MAYGFNKKGGLTTSGTAKVLAFNGQRPITKPNIPGLSGHTLGGVTILEFLEGFFPAVPPGTSIVGGGTRQFGASPEVTLSWSVVKNTFPITEINVAGTAIVPTGNNQSGTLTVMAQQNIATTFQMYAKAGKDTAYASTTIGWSHKRFWGTTTKDGINQAITDADILALSQEFASNRVKTLSGFDGRGQYFIYVFPTAWGVPQFSVNGLPNTAFTRVRTGAFVNSDGFSSSFDVWMSNTTVSGLANYQIN